MQELADFPPISADNLNSIEVKNGTFEVIVKDKVSSCFYLRASFYCITLFSSLLEYLDGMCRFKMIFSGNKSRMNTVKTKELMFPLTAQRG